MLMLLFFLFCSDVSEIYIINASTIKYSHFIFIICHVNKLNCSFASCHVLYIIISSFFLHFLSLFVVHLYTENELFAVNRFALWAFYHFGDRFAFVAIIVSIAFHLYYIQVAKFDNTKGKMHIIQLHAREMDFGFSSCIFCFPFWIEITAPFQ